MLAAHMFAGDNEHYLPYPGWGGAPPDRDNWAHDTKSEDSLVKDSPLVVSNQVKITSYSWNAALIA